MLPRQEKHVVCELQEGCISNAGDDTPTLRRKVERAMLEVRAIRQDNATMGTLLAQHIARGFWGFKSTKNDSSLRTEINALAVVDMHKEYSFQW